METKTESELKQVRLDKTHDITAFTSKNVCRYTLGGVFYCAKDRTLVATDGCVLIQVPALNGEAGEFPSSPGQGEAPDDMIIPADKFGKAIKSIPKSSLPIYESALLTQSNQKNEPAVVSMVDDAGSNDLTINRIDGRFPDYKNVIPNEAPYLVVVLSAANLKKIADYATKHASEKKNSIRFEFSAESTDPVRFSINLTKDRNATGVIMPMRST